MEQSGRCTEVSEKRWKVMVSAPYMQLEIEKFRRWFAEHDIDIDVPKVRERMEERDLLPIIGKYDGVICGDDRFTEKVYQAAKKLKVISKWGTGIDSIHKEIAEKYGVTVCNTPDAFSHPVSDTVLGFMLCFSRTILASDRLMKNGAWEKIQGKTLGEQTLGIIGCGNVGSRVAKKANAFDMRILAYDIREIPKAILEQYGIKQVDLDTLLEESDFVSTNCDLNDSSYHILSVDEFKKMKQTAIVINTARGPVIDEAALVCALQEKEIAGCGLDVYEYEPLPVDSPLRKMDNVILSSHNSNSSPQYWEKVHYNTLDNLYRVLKKDS